jgi:hypothetical protein
MAIAKALRFPRRLPACSISTAQRRVWNHARDKTQKLEEEKFEWYTPATFYSVRLGDVLKDRYRVIGKLGYGAYSTVWLCRDSQYVFCCLPITIFFFCPWGLEGSL